MESVPCIKGDMKEKYEYTCVIRISGQRLMEVDIITGDGAVSENTGRCKSI